jgi:transposase InsO family protein
MGRLCSQRLLGQGLAVLDANKWMVKRSYDQRLLASDVASLLAPPVRELETFTVAQRKVASAKAQCVEAFREANRTQKGSQKDWLPSLLAGLNRQHPILNGVSRSRLFVWARDYHGPKDTLKLIDRRGGNTVGEADPACWDALRKLYLDPREPSLRTCWAHVEALAAENGWRWLTYKTCQRQLNAHIPPAVQAKFRQPEQYRQQLAAYIPQDPEGWEAGECWIGDHTQLDLWCRYSDTIIRPWVTSWFDARTSRIAGWTLSPSPNSSTILAALRSGLIDPANKGGPRCTWIDNGKDYDSYVFHGETKSVRKRRVLCHDERVEVLETCTGIFKLLSIEAHFALPYNSNGKSKIERWHGTMHSQFDKSFATYCGRNPEHRPEHLYDLLKAGKHVPTFEYVLDRLTNYIAGFNADANHQRMTCEHMSPDQAMAELRTDVRQLADPAALDLLMQVWHKPVRVNKNGITISPAGKAESYGCIEPALIPYKALSLAERPQVRVSYDPQDVTRIRVFDMQWRFICEASHNGMGGDHGPVPQQALKDQMKKVRKYNKMQNEIRADPMVELESPMERAAIAARKQLPTRTTPQLHGPGGIRLIQTPLDGASKQIQKQSMRRAAGAESLGNSDLALPSTMSLLDQFDDRNDSQDGAPMSWAAIDDALGENQ